MHPEIQKILDQISSQDTKIRYAIFGVLLLLFISIDCFLILNFQFNAIAKTTEAVEKLRADSQGVRNNILRANSIKKGMEDMKSKFQALNSKIRDVADTSAIFEEISRVANETQVHIDQISPSKDGQELLLKGPEGKYFALPIVISAHSGYHMFGRFLGRLENSNILFLVKELKLDGNERDVVNIGIQATIKIVLVDRTPETKK